MTTAETQHNKPRFEDVLPETFQIISAGIDAFHLVNMADRYVDESLLYTKEELDLVDPRLVPLMRHVHVMERVRVVRDSIAYWADASRLPQVSCTWGQELVTLALANITAVERLCTEQCEMECTTNYYQVKTTDELLTYAHYYTEGRTLKLTFDWVEQHYPGAVGRLHAAQNLGLAADETAQYAFHYIGSEQQVDLPTTWTLTTLPEPAELHV